MKKTIWIVVAVVVILVIGFGVAKQNSSNQKTIKIGGAFGLTGICAEWGEGELKAANLAIEEINNNGGIDSQLLEMVVEDTLCEVKATINATSKLINIDKVQALIGPTWGDSFQAVYSVIRDAKVVSIAPIAIEALEFNNESLDYIFSTWFPQRAEIDRLQRYASANGFKDFTVVKDQDPFSVMMVGLFKSEASKNGINVIEEHEFVTGSRDFKTIISKIKSKNPQAIFLSFLDPGAKPIFLKQARDLGLKQQLFSAADIQDQALLENFASVLEGVIYTYPQKSERYADFLAKHMKKYGTNPQGPSAAHAYDAVMILVEALKTGARTGSEIEDKLLSVSTQGVAVGEVKFTASHQVSGGDFEIKTVKDGQFVTIEN